MSKRFYRGGGGKKFYYDTTWEYSRRRKVYEEARSHRQSHQAGYPEYQARPRNIQEEAKVSEAKAHSRAFERQYYKTHPGAEPGSYSPARMVAPGEEGGGEPGTRAVVVDPGPYQHPTAGEIITSGAPSVEEPGDIIPDRLDTLRHKYVVEEPQYHEVEGKFYRGEAMAQKVYEMGEGADYEEKISVLPVGDGVGVKLPFKMTEETARDWLSRTEETQGWRVLEYERQLEEYKKAKAEQETFVRAVGGKRTVWGGAFEGSHVEYSLPQASQVKPEEPVAPERSYSQVFLDTPLGKVDLTGFSSKTGVTETIRNLAQAYHFQVEEDRLKTEFYLKYPHLIPEPSVVDPSGTREKMSAEEFKVYQKEKLREVGVESTIAHDKIATWEAQEIRRQRDYVRLGIKGAGFDTIEGFYLHPEHFSLTSKDAFKLQVGLGQKQSRVTGGFVTGAILGLSVFNPGLTSMTARVWVGTKLTAGYLLYEPGGELVHQASGGRVPKWLGGMIVSGAVYYGLSASEPLLFPGPTKVLGASVRHTIESESQRRSVSTHKIGAEGRSVLFKGGATGKYPGGVPRGATLSGVTETWGGGYNVRTESLLGARVQHITGKEVQYIQDGEVFTVGKWTARGRTFFNLLKTKVQGKTSFRGDVNRMGTGVGRTLPRIGPSKEGLTGRLGGVEFRGTGDSMRIITPTGRSFGHDAFIKGTLKTSMSPKTWRSEPLQFSIKQKINQLIGFTDDVLGHKKVVRSGTEVARVDKVKFLDKTFSRVSPDKELIKQKNIYSLEHLTRKPPGTGTGASVKSTLGLPSYPSYGGYKPPVAGSLRHVDIVQKVVRSGHILKESPASREILKSSQAKVTGTYGFKSKFLETITKVKEIGKAQTEKIPFARSNWMKNFPKSPGAEAKFPEMMTSGHVGPQLSQMEQSTKTVNTLTSKAVESVGRAVQGVDTPEVLFSSIVASAPQRSISAPSLRTFDYQSPLAMGRMEQVAYMEPQSRLDQVTPLASRMESIPLQEQMRDTVPVLEQRRDQVVVAQQRSEQVLTPAQRMEQITVPAQRFDTIPVARFDYVPLLPGVPRPPMDVGVPEVGLPMIPFPGFGRGGVSRMLKGRTWGEVSGVMEPWEMESDLLNGLGTTKKKRRKK